MAKKQTSSRVSTIAAKHMARIRRVKANYPRGWRHWGFVIGGDDLAALCGSLIGQDETKGQAKRRKVRR